MKLLKIVIPILILIIIGVIFGATQQEINTESIEQMPTSSEMDILLDKIESDKIKNDESQNPFIPNERNWITSGPFKIDRSEYRLGEKIFVNIDSLINTDKGKIVFLRPINSTHHDTYHTMPFDGSVKRNNYYLTPDLSEFRGICSAEELIGDWKVKFLGTNFQDLEFKITKQIIPGFEERYQTIVNKGKC